MAPSPENDNTPKAPDKGGERARHNEGATSNPVTENKHTSVTKLNDGELKALLDEAISYKSPKDKEGKSALFKDLLSTAEEEERNARASSAGGSELVRYCNPSAKRRSRHKREANSISENVTHGGSLNNLAKEELYEPTHHYRPRKTVSARQREGGSLPCNVNAGAATFDFPEEVFGKREPRSTVIDMETDSLLENDSLNQCYTEQVEHDKKDTRIPEKFTTSAEIQVGLVQPEQDLKVVVQPEQDLKMVTAEVTETSSTMNGNVDDKVPFTVLEQAENLMSGFGPKEPFQTKVSPCTVNYFNTPPTTTAMDKKVDENGNAVNTQGTSDNKKNKKKKVLADKNVVVCEAKDVIGHRSDIIDDVDKLIEFIGGNEDGSGSAIKSKSNVHKSKLHKHVSSDDSSGKNSKKQQRKGSKGKSLSAIHKSNSCEEISSTNRDSFNYSDASQELDSKGIKTAGKGGAEKARRQWATSEFYTNASVENFESDFRVVTKKKKSKKRRNSISSSRRQTFSLETGGGDFNRVSSSSVRRKTASSVPHSEKSNDSSDVDSTDSVFSDMKLDSTSAPISYADIARNSNNPVVNRSPPTETDDEPKQSVETKPKVSERAPAPPQIQQVTQQQEPKMVPPDVHNVHNFPTIQNNKQPQPSERTVSKQTPNTYSKIYKNNQNNLKNLKNKTFVQKPPNNFHIENLMMFQNSESLGMHNHAMLSSIPDVQTIEKMHFDKMHGANLLPNHVGQPYKPAEHPMAHPPEKQSLVCDSAVERTNNVNSSASNSSCGGSRPAVVILSGDGKEVSGLTFGFDINEQLLNEDICDGFISRFVAPDKLNTGAYNHDKIISFIEQAWDEVIESNVRYYTDDS